MDGGPSSAPRARVTVLYRARVQGGQRVSFGGGDESVGDAVVRPPLDVTVVVPTHDRCASLMRTLAALDGQVGVTPAGRAFTYEVVVVADGCTDGTHSALRSANTRFPLRVVEQVNSGPSAARNAGISIAAGDIVVFIDDDVVPAPCCLGVHVGRHDDDPSVVVIGPMSTPRDHRLAPWVAWEQHQLEKWYPFFRSHPGAGYHHFYTANASVRRSYLERVGGFDGTFRRAEDIELAHRLERAGCHFVVDLDAAATHYADRSLESWRSIAHDYGRNEVLFDAIGMSDRLDRLREKHAATSRLQQFVVEHVAPHPRLVARLAGASEAFGTRADAIGARSLAGAAFSGAYALRFHGGVVEGLGSGAAYRAVLRGPSALPVGVGVVVEQALGHITHGANLERLLGRVDEIEVVYLPIDQSIGRHARRLPLWSNWTVRAGVRARRAVARTWRRDRPLDVLFVHTQVPAMFLGRWMRRIPTIVSLDATPLQYDELGESYDHRRGPAFVEAAKHRVHLATLRRAHHLVTWSDWAKQGLVRDYGIDEAKISVIPPGVDLAVWQPSGRAGGREGPIGPSSTGPLRILFVGGDLHRKGGDLLVRAAGILAGRAGVPSFEVHLVTRDEVPPVAGVTVHRGLGPNSPDLLRLYASADIFCLPTLGDCLPMVLAEAGAAGLPIVSTDVGAVGEIVRHGETGLLVRPGDLDGLVGALEQLLTDDDLRARVGRNVHRLVTESHDADRNARTIAELLTDVVPGTSNV